MSKHTQGSWELISIPGHLTTLQNDKGEIIFKIRSGMMPSYVDGNVIKAAPELLKELKHLVKLIEPVLSEVNIPGLATLNGAKRAIDKAEGKE